MNMNKITSVAALLFVGFGLTGSAYAASDEQNLVDEARITADHLKTDKEFGKAPQMLQQARAVLIVPNLVKAGFFLGGEGGDGVLLARTGTGWSDPVFYTLGSASFGLQAGIQSAEVVALVMTDRGLKALEQDEFKFGAQAGLTVVTLGASAQAASSTALDTADIIAWASSSGAYAGITLEGSVVKPRDSYNQAYYGHSVTLAGLLNKTGTEAGTKDLRLSLVRAATPMSGQ